MVTGARHEIETRIPIVTLELRVKAREVRRKWQGHTSGDRNNNSSTVAHDNLEEGTSDRVGNAAGAGSCRNRCSWECGPHE